MRERRVLQDRYVSIMMVAPSDFRNMSDSSYSARQQDKSNFRKIECRGGERETFIISCTSVKM